MPRWIAPFASARLMAASPGLVALGSMTWLAAGAGATQARAEMVSTGVFSGQDEQDAVNPLDPSGTAPIIPPAGIRSPDTEITHPPDPVVANVEGHPILLSDLGDAVQTLPEALRKMPFEVIYPTLLDRMVDRDALALMARREGLDEDPKVKREIEAATARVLESALLQRTAVLQVTEAAIQARYLRDYAGRQAVEEVHARHILVGSEAEAKRLIGELGKGSDFTTLARQFSKDPDSARGGDVGFFRQDQVWPGFADLAFSLKPGEVAQTPIFNEFGWHVVQTLERRVVPPPAAAQLHDAIRKTLWQEAVRRVVAAARDGLRVDKFDMGGGRIYDRAGAAISGEGSSDKGRAPATNDKPATAVRAPGPNSPSSAPLNRLDAR